MKNIILVGLFVLSMGGNWQGSIISEAYAAGDCQKRLDDNYVKQILANQGTDPHALKKEYLGNKAKISLYELCECDDGVIAIRLKKCQGMEERTWATTK